MNNEDQLPADELAMWCVCVSLCVCVCARVGLRDPCLNAVWRKTIRDRPLQQYLAAVCYCFFDFVHCPTDHGTASIPTSQFPGQEKKSTGRALAEMTKMLSFLANSFVSLPTLQAITRFASAAAICRSQNLALDSRKTLVAIPKFKNMLQELGGAFSLIVLPHDSLTQAGKVA